MDFPANVVRQGQVSEWLQKQFTKHAENTMQWKKHKSSPSMFSVLSLPLSSNNSHSSHWRVSKGNHVPYFTLSTHGSMCLDFKERENNKREVGISPCYPREDPDTSLDPSQRWIWSDDLSLRPFSLNYPSFISSPSFSRPSLSLSPSSLSLSQCLTRESVGVIGLRDCEGRNEQKWDLVANSCKGEDRGCGEIHSLEGDEHIVVISL